MPIIAAFLGMLIRVYHADHDPPHIHVQYGEYEAIAEIRTGRIIRGRLPRRVERILREWLRVRRREVVGAWRDARAHRTPRRVDPLA